MLHWLYDPHRKIRRFVDENIKSKPQPVQHPKVMEIMSMAIQHGMRPSDVDSLAEELEPEKLVAPKTDAERFERIYYMMTLLLDDLNFDAAEKDFLKEYALQIGYPIEKAPFIIRDIYNGLKTEASVEEIKVNINKILQS